MKLALAIKLSPCFTYGFLSRLALVVKLGLFLSFQPKKRILKRIHVVDGILRDLPFHQGLAADVPCKVNLLSMDCNIIIWTAYSHVCSHEDGCIRLCCQSVGKITSLENQSQDSNKSCDSTLVLTLEQDLGRM